MIKKRVKQIKPRLYNAMIDNVTNEGDGSVTVQLSLDMGKGTKFTERYTMRPETIPEVGHNRYFVANTQLGIYTSIGADNIHHASNKCTKLFGPNWSFLREEHNCSELRGYQHFTVAQ